MDSKPVQIGAVLYPGFEMLDLFGPLEMFSILGSELVTIHLIAAAESCPDRLVVWR